MRNANNAKIHAISLARASRSQLRVSRDGVTKNRQSGPTPSVILDGRQFTTQFTAQSTNGASEALRSADPSSRNYMESTVRLTRQTFGDTLPHDFLTPDEYKIYVRLYGPPTQESNPDDVKLLQDLEEELGEEEVVSEEYETEESNVDREMGEEEAVSEGHEAGGLNVDREMGEQELEAEESENLSDFEDTDSKPPEPLVDAEGAEFRARMTLYRDIVAAKRAAEPHDIGIEEAKGTEENAIVERFENDLDEEQYSDQNEDPELEVEDFDEVDEGGDAIRSHPFTAAGRFGTSPSTLQIPKQTVANPIASLLADTSNKHLRETAQEVFGGPQLPNSTATPSTKGHLQQQPIALAASHFRMQEMEANAYLAAIIPGAYAAITSTLTEIRKRVGPEWIRSLLEKEGGPLVLDAGGGGSGVLAWREVLRAEWELFNSGKGPAPVGESTVVIGSSPLRHRVSKLLENTTFLPRLPDYNPNLNHPALENPKASPRKRYDIIIAPHSLWALKEDYVRKSQVQNFWSLLNPNGGILVLIEKGVPRGFELIAGARETLLKHHIASPSSPTVENQIQEPFEGRIREKEVGMILAPCTNHFKCPLYLTHGRNKGRKDLCHFSQRFIRPPFLQQILGAKDRNHEDVDFSYIAVQRGVDKRIEYGVLQGPAATDAAFAGYEGEEQDETNSTEEAQGLLETQTPEFSPFSMPRSIMPPLKRRGHVILDLCTPSGKVERWTVPKSFSKQAYRDARKSQWGDLWALGAKTRILRNVRLGVKDRQVKGKSAYKGRKDGGDDDENHRDIGLKIKYGKQTKKGRTPKLGMNMSEDDL